MFILLAQTYHAVMHQVMEGAALANIYIGVRKESWLRSGGVKLRTLDRPRAREARGPF